MAARDEFTPGKRDPEARRRAIVDAAAALLIEDGPRVLTHRRIAERAGVSLGSTTQLFSSLEELREAALESLAEEIDASIDEIARAIPALEAAPEAIASEMLEFLEDTRQVRADLTLITAAMDDHGLRKLARRWHHRLVEVLTPLIGRDRAVILAVFLDGATVHAALNDQPLGREELTRAVRALMLLPLDGEPAP